MIKYPQKVKIIEHHSGGESDYEVISNVSDDDDQIVYQRLKEDVEKETLAVVHNTVEKGNPEASDENQRDVKIRLSLPKTGNDPQGAIKKSRSENFGPRLESPKLVVNRKSLINFDQSNVVIYDVPRNRGMSVPTIQPKIITPTPRPQTENSLSPINLNSTNRASCLNVIETLPVSSIQSTTRNLQKIPSSTFLTNPGSSRAGSVSSTQKIGVARFLEEKFKCSICRNAFTDPKVLSCLHSFCCQCIIEHENLRNPTAVTNQFWSKLSDTSENDCGLSFSGSTTPQENPDRSGSRRGTIASQSRASLRPRTSSAVSIISKPKFIHCPTCDVETELPIGGISRLPVNFVLLRQTNEALAKLRSDTKSNSTLCNLCSTETTAAFYCQTCNLSLCTFCQEAHLRQRLTSNHQIRSIDHNQRGNDQSTSPNKTLKCPIHFTHDLKLFCTVCYQVACSDCTILIHRGHKCEPLSKASKVYIKLIKKKLEQIRPISDYANHTISKLNSLTKKINRKCNQVQSEVDVFLEEYYLALDVHRKTLLNQIVRAKEAKLEMIKKEQAELEQKSTDAKSAIQFTENLLFDGSEIEILTLAGILLRRFDECKTSEKGMEMKVTDAVRFLPEVRAPSTKPQNNIPLYGIITTQTAVPKLCTLETKEKELMNLRVHKTAELVIVSKDSADQPLCHGGLDIVAELRYKDASSRRISTQIIDKRDGTYLISFVPDASGFMTLAICVQGKHVKKSPFTLCARNLRPHLGIYHCCSFCSSGGNRVVLCGCGGTMEGGYQGCGHGHEGHPGRRHWSCCANILENSECTKANNLPVAIE